jgi:hypothetical protein
VQPRLDHRADEAGAIAPVEVELEIDVRDALEPRGLGGPGLPEAARRLEPASDAPEQLGSIPAQHSNDEVRSRVSTSEMNLETHPSRNRGQRRHHLANALQSDSIHEAVAGGRLEAVDEIGDERRQSYLFISS